MMSKSKQDQIEEFAAMCELKDGVLRSPIVYSMNKAGKILQWQVFVGLSDGSPVTDELIKKAPLPEDVSGVYWTEAGQMGGKITRSQRTTATGKNPGRANSTTSLTQAIFEARSEFNKKIKQGGVVDRDKIRTNATLDELIADNQWRVIPMKLHDAKKHWNKVKYPVYVQPKYDGVLFVVMSHPALPEREVDGKKARIDGYSRGRELIESQDHVLAELVEPLASRPGLYVVGELYKEGKHLQEISGMSRRKKPGENVITLDYYIFDCFRIGENVGFEQRLEWLRDLQKDTPGIYVKFAPTSIAENPAALNQYYESILAEGKEGIVIRNRDSPYEYGISREIRSLYTLKLKPRMDEEYPVVGFTDGEGKEKGVVIWECAENDKGVMSRAGKKLPLEERLKFRVTPNMDYERRRIIFRNLTENPDLFKSIYGRLLTVDFAELSKDNFLPQQPKGKSFRDADVNELLLSLK